MSPLSRSPLVIAAVALVLGCPLAASAQVAGDSTRVLPRGLFRADVRYVYANTGLRSQKGALSQDDDLADKVGLLTELVGSAADFGDTLVQYRGSAQVVAPSLFYGLLDRISVGFVLPVFLDARVDLERLQVETGAVGYNPDFITDMTRQSPVLSASDPRAIPGADGVRRLVTDVFQYEPLEDWSGSGIGDLQLISRALAYSGAALKAGGQLAVQVPTGKADNPNNLLDFGLGGGQVDVGFLGLFDLTPTPWLIINLRGGYTFQLANEETTRVYDDASLPLAPVSQLPEQYADLGQQRDVVRDLGDVWQVGSSMRVERGIWIAAAGYDYFSKAQDRYRSDAGAHPAMGSYTDYYVHSVSGTVGIDLVRSFLRGSAPVPMTFELSLTQAFSDREASNMTMAQATTTLYFGSADSARKGMP